MERSGLPSTNVAEPESSKAPMGRFAKPRAHPDASFSTVTAANADTLRPGKENESNWLPAPADKFVLMMRMYRPRETPPSILDGIWKIAPVREAN
jgi:hypothetical protein